MMLIIQHTARSGCADTAGRLTPPAMPAPQKPAEQRGRHAKSSPKQKRLLCSHEDLYILAQGSLGANKTPMVLCSTDETREISRPVRLLVRSAFPPATATTPTLSVNRIWPPPA